MDIGEKIKYHRKLKSLTQKELAHGICSITYLSKIENRKISYNQEILSRLCERLGIKNEQKQKQDSSKDIEQMEIRLNKWYKVIKNRNEGEAKEIKKLIHEGIQKIDEPSILITYYIFLLRYHLLMKDLVKSKQIIDNLKSVKNNFTNIQKYYYHYALGTYHYLQDDLTKSVECFSKAENLNHLLHQDETELIYNLALIHSRLYHVTLSIHYANTALELFNKKMDYFQSIEVQNILAINYIRIRLYDNANENLQQSLKLAEKLNDNYLLGNIYHNLGYLYAEKKEHNLAIKYYHKSLSFEENNIEWYTNTTYYLIKEYFASNQFDKAITWVEKAIEMVGKNDKNQIQIKIKALKSLYTLTDKNTEKSNLEEDRIYLEKIVITFFQKKQNYIDLSYYAEKLADYYANQNKYKKSSYFYKLANDSLKKIQKY